MGSEEQLMTWIVEIEFRRGAPTFETTVISPTSNGAKLLAIQAACNAGWADAEVRRMTLYPQVF